MTKSNSWLAEDTAKDGTWLPVGELLAGVMMSFILVAVVTVTRLDGVHPPRSAAVYNEAPRGPRQTLEQALTPAPARRDAAPAHLAGLASAAPGAPPAAAVTGGALQLAAATGLSLLERVRLRPVQPEMTGAGAVLRDALAAEFAPDLKRWHARLAPDLSVRFDEPELLFVNGKPALTPEFKRVLGDFFPRYVRVLSDPRVSGSVASLSVETHNASAWAGAGAAEYTSLREMALAERRTQATLAAVLLLPEPAGRKGWLAQKLVVEDLPAAGDEVDALHCVAFKVRVAGSPAVAS